MKRKVLYLLQCVVMIVLSACSEDDLQSLQAAFESNVQEVTMGESVTFKDASIGEPTKWNWHFDGGEPETSVLFYSRERISFPCSSNNTTTSPG